MPFTFSHPAIILPLILSKRLKLSTTGLIIGSITPDFEYFIRMKIQTDFSHSLHGLFWFDLPLGLILCFVFHNLVRQSLLKNSPRPIQMRFTSLENFNWNTYFLSHWVRVCVSILIGGMSHLLWDGFTHEHGFFVEKINILQTLVEYKKFSMPTYNVMQHASTLLGGLLLIVAFFSVKKAGGQTDDPSAIYWVIIFIITLGIVLLRAISGLKWYEYGNFIATFISGLFIGLIVASMLFSNKIKTES